MAKTTLTGFGVLLRKHRLDRGETLYDMARGIGVSSSFLSAVETGQKHAPQELLDKLVKHLNLDMVDQLQLREAAQHTGPELRIPLRGKSKDAREVAAMFARRFESCDMEALRQALEKLDFKKDATK
jgi:transcriptional regulator with XRE-family HTH domain